MVPAERREVRHVYGVDASAAAPERIEHAAEIAAIEEDDRGDDQVECGRAARLVLMTAVAETAEAMQGDRAAEGVERLALVELGRDQLPERRALEPAQSE